MAVVFKYTAELLLLSPPPGPFLHPLAARTTGKNSLCRQSRYFSGPPPGAGLWRRRRQCNLHLPLSPYLNSFWHISSLPYKSVLHLAGSQGGSQTPLAKDVDASSDSLVMPGPGSCHRWFLPRGLHPRFRGTRLASSSALWALKIVRSPLLSKPGWSQVLFQCSHCKHGRSCLHLALGWGLLEKSDLGTSSRSGTRQKQESPVTPQKHAFFLFFHLQN